MVGRDRPELSTVMFEEDGAFCEYRVASFPTEPVVFENLGALVDNKSGTVDEHQNQGSSFIRVTRRSNSWS